MKHFMDGVLSSGGTVIDRGSMKLQQPSASSAVDKNNPNGIGALLADALNRMSFKEREELYEEIHGVSSTIQETEKLIADSLAAMDEELQFLRVKPAYDLASNGSEETKNYVTSRKFRLIFLRAQRFHPRKAAEHLVRYMEGKLELFGKTTLGRTLRLSDLNHDDMASLRSGAFQILPKRDRSGRVIFGMFLELTPQRAYKQVINVLRTIAFVSMAVCEDDEETQKRGIIGVSYSVGGKALERDNEYTLGVRKLGTWLPWRLEAMHFCSGETSATQKWVHSLVEAVSPHLQVRFRFHHGSHTECQYTLLSFGIPVDCILPVSYDGELKLTNHAKWIAKQKVKDQFESSAANRGKSFTGIDLPAVKDVLAGRGKLVQDHSGNIEMRAIVGTYKQESELARSKEQKDAVFQKVVDYIHAQGGRFLKQESNGWWFELSDDEAARKRVARSFRTLSDKDGSVDDFPLFIQSDDGGKRHRITK